MDFVVVGPPLIRVSNFQIFAPTRSTSELNAS